MQYFKEEYHDKNSGEQFWANTIWIRSKDHSDRLTGWDPYLSGWTEQNNTGRSTCIGIIKIQGPFEFF